MARKARITTAPSGATIIPFPADRVRSDIPPFDPNNPLHQAAWEATWKAGRAILARMEGR